MADANISNSHNEEIVRYEHGRKNVGAKRVVVYGYDAGVDMYYPITPVDNGDGTYSSGSSLKNGKTVLFAKVDTATGGDTQVVAASVGNKIKLLSCKLVSSGTVSTKWRSGTTDLEGANPLVANSGYILPASSPGQGHYLETAVNTALNINLSGAVQVSGHISYYLEA